MKQKRSAARRPFQVTVLANRRFQIPRVKTIKPSHRSLFGISFVVVLKLTQWLLDSLSRLDTPKTRGIVLPVNSLQNSFALRNA